MIISLLGWFGAGLYLLNHAGLALNHGHESRLYYSLNLLAAAALVVSSAALASWQPVLTNAFWIVVSALALLHWPKAATPTATRVPEAWIFWPLIGALFVGGALVPLAHYAGLATLGWVGTLMFSAAYLAFALGIVQRRRFLLYNAIAAFALVPILYVDANWPVFALEVIWGLTSVIGWWRAQD